MSRYPLTSRFDGERSEPGILDQISGRFGLFAKGLDFCIPKQLGTGGG
jgi:hypothetical protein